MKAHERATLLERYGGLPSLTDAEARIAAQPTNDAQEQYIHEKIWSVAAAVREANLRLPPSQPVQYVPRVYRPVEPERDDF